MAKNHNKTEDKNYETTIDFSVENNSHTRTFHMIQDHCGDKHCKILDAGCAAGFLGEAIKEYGHEVWGIEMSADAAKAARQRLDNVFHGTIEEYLSSPEFVNEKFDYVLFGDVLEHLVDPLTILKNITSRLTQNGAVVASIPNVAHIAVRAMLLEGKWEYAEYGILDDTHLRFFTRDSIVELFSKANLEIKCFSSIDIPAELTGIQTRPAILSKATEIAADEEQEAFQYVILAHKPNSELIHNKDYLTTNCTHVLCLLHNVDWSVGKIRILDPLNSLSAYYGAYIRVVQLGQQTREDIEWADTVIFQRESNYYMLSILADLQNMGKKIILDLDDLLTEVPEFLFSHEYLDSIKPYIEETLRIVDAVTVTTPRLQKKIKHYNPNVHVVPNCSYTSYSPATHNNDASQITLVVGSTDTVRVDFILPTLKKLKHEHKDTIRIVVIGPPADSFINAEVDIEAHPIMTHEQFKLFISDQDNSIGIIPLDDSVFSNCKSAVKYFDYSLAHIPTICSKVPPYSDVVSHGETGILCENNETSWYNEISKLMASAEIRKTISNNASRFVKSNFSMHHAAVSWNEVLNNTSAGQGQKGSELLKGIKIKSIKAKTIFNLAVNKSSYSKVYYLLRAEGINGVRDRIKQFL